MPPICRPATARTKTSVSRKGGARARLLERLGERSSQRDIDVETAVIRLRGVDDRRGCRLINHRRRGIIAVAVVAGLTPSPTPAVPMAVPIMVMAPSLMALPSAVPALVGLRRSRGDTSRRDRAERQRRQGDAPAAPFACIR